MSLQIKRESFLLKSYVSDGDTNIYYYYYPPPSYIKGSISVTVPSLALS